MKKSLPKEWKAEMPEAQEDDLMHKALRQKFDEELKEKWAAQLAEQGVLRQPASGSGGAATVPMRPNRGKWWAAAASVLVLFGLAWWLFLQPSQPGGGQLADQYLKEMASQAAQTQKGVGDDAVWQKAKDAYAEGDFSGAISSLEALAATKPLDAGQSYLLAFCQALTVPPAYDLALKTLENARQYNLANQSDSYQAEIEWATALVLLKKKEIAPAEAKLKEIVQANGWYASKAQQLLKALE